MPHIVKYEDDWSNLANHLRMVEAEGGGLSEALKQLYRQQQKSGFIRDKLENVERCKFFDPQNPSNYFQVQYNPNRALRFAGAGIKQPPNGSIIANDGCFLCRDNILWQQGGIQLGYDIHLGGQVFYAWMNPFPLLPVHVVIAAREHIPQDCGLRDQSGEKLGSFLKDFVELASRLPGYVGFFNGVDAGASIPGHLHFQFFSRPADTSQFPLEKAVSDARAKNSDVGFVNDYPLAVRYWHGSPEEVAKKASQWMQQWASSNRKRLDNLTGNLIASLDETTNELMLCFVPRDRNRKCNGDDMGVIGGLEVLGELVYSSKQQKQMLDEGKVDYASIRQHLAGVFTPFYHN